jgi:general secretion pathway protein B
MSFILDALKKSESERQRQNIPGMMETVIVRPRSRLPAWAIALCALLAVNLIALVFVLMRGYFAAPRMQTPPEQASSQSRPKTPPAATAGHFSPLDTPTVYAPEIPVTAAPGPPAAAARPVTPGSSGVHAVRRHDPVLADEDYKSDDAEVLPTINEINLTGANALPELHLDVHVFATRSSERFVFVNMRKYHEGATLEEGPVIERIRRDGVILNYRGVRFLLPRQ